MIMIFILKNENKKIEKKGSYLFFSKKKMVFFN